MPPKRRATSQPETGPDPKKRATRSSTRLNQSTSQEKVSDSRQPKGISKKKTGKAEADETILKSPTKSKLSSSKGKAATAVTSNIQGSTQFNVTNLTITSPIHNNTIQCQLYKSQNTSHSAPQTLIFTHGAGGTLSAPAVVNFCTGFSESLSVLGFQGSMNLSARVKGFHACIEHLRKEQEQDEHEEEAETATLLLGGHSMGARAAVVAATEILSLEQKSEDGTKMREKHNVQLILVSYPLKGPKGDLRDAILLALPPHVSVLFIIGERDSMCPLESLNAVRDKMKAQSRLVVARGADHGMHVKPTKREREVGVQTGRVAARWVGSGLEGAKEGDGVGDGDGSVIYVGGEEGES